MKSSEFINEGADPNAPFNQYDLHDLVNPVHPEVSKVENAARLKQIIESNCSQMLAAYRQSKKVLYRGLWSRDDIVITNIRPDRKPVEMYQSMHDLLDKVFKSIGLTATRSNSIFCSCNVSTAEGWGGGGVPYVIFVKDGWTGTVFDKVRNDYLFNLVAYEHEDFEHLRKVLLSYKPISFNDISKLKWVLSKNFDDILITGSSYIAVKINAITIPEILGFVPEDIADYHDYDPEDVDSSENWKGIPKVYNEDRKTKNKSTT